MIEDLKPTIKKIYPLAISGDDWSISFRRSPTPGVEVKGRCPTQAEVLDVFATSFSYNSFPMLLPVIIHIAAVAAHQKSAKPLQEDGETLDLRCKNFDTLERMHKQEPWSNDQARHYEGGWEAAVGYYFSRG